MSQLKPGATYIYERDNDKIYAREIGNTDRVLIGEGHTTNSYQRAMNITKEWIPIIEAAEHNPALQDALERVKLIYELSKKQDTIFHHPV